MPAVGVKSFNDAKFRKVVRLMESDREAERNVALNQAARLCAECNPPVPLIEAICQTFGSDRSEADEIAREALKVTKALEQQKQMNRDLEDRLAELELRVVEAAPRPVEGDWPTLPLLHPNVLLAATAVVVASQWITLRFFGNEASPDELFVAMWIRGAAMALFAFWSVAVYKCYGLKQLFIRWSTWVCGWGIVLGWIHVITNPTWKTTDNFPMTYLPVNWWDGIPLNGTGAHAAIAIFMLAVVMDTNLRGQCTTWLINTIRKGIEDAERNRKKL